MATPDVLNRFRQPQYTGDNRCIPCTILNIVISALLTASVVAGALWYGAEAEVVLFIGIIMALLSVTVIYFRGYLIPGTPWFTKTYFPDWLLRQFDKRPSTDTSGDGELDVEMTLKHAGVMTDCQHEADLCLTDSFRTAWRDRIAAVRTGDTSREDLAHILNVDPVQLTVTEHESAFVARFQDRPVGQWESRAAFLADIAAANELDNRVHDWSSLNIQQRSNILQNLRIFLEQCPQCDGSVTMDQEIVESCCRSVDTVAVTCEDCNARVFKADKPV